MRREQIFVATMADDFKETIAKYGVGVKIDHFCTAVNMEEPQFSMLDGEVKDALTGTEKVHIFMRLLTNCTRRLLILWLWSWHIKDWSRHIS